MKGINLNVKYEPYYGISIYVWKVEIDADSREDFIEKMFKALKEEWVIKNVDIADWVDFVHTLSNNLNGEDLYNNVVNNFIYIEELEKKAYELGISLNCIYKNRHSYSDSETISIYNKLTPYLMNKDDFKEYFMEELRKNDEKVYICLFDDIEAKKSLIDKLNLNIEREQHSIDYYNKNIEHCKENIKNMEKELKELEGLESE